MLELMMNKFIFQFHLLMHSQLTMHMILLMLTYLMKNAFVVDDADPLEVHVLHDPDNPNIVLGALFPDIIVFRKAITHHAVKTGFELAGRKTDKTRFLARCAARGCPWRIHASTIYDKKTIKIICCDLFLTFF
jgi:hypothetical protein